MSGLPPFGVVFEFYYDEIGNAPPIIRIPLAIFLTILAILDEVGVFRRKLTAGDGSNNPEECFLIGSGNEGDTTDEPQTTTLTMTTQAQEDLQNIVTHMEDRTDFSADHLRSLYSSLMYGMLEAEDEQTKQDIDKAITEAIGSIDTNGDGIIDVWEMEHVTLPADGSKFVFDDVVACTSTTGGNVEDACVTADNVVDFLNMFYGGTEIISDDVAKHIRESSGADACFTRDEFEKTFTAVPEDVDTLSAGLSAQPMDLSFVLSMAFGVGTALFVSGLSLPF